MEQTEVIRHILPELFKAYDIRSLVDVPCGDFFWMKNVDLNGIQYNGYDIVREMIQKNKDLYETDMIRFGHLDMCVSPPPKADMIFCRDALVHLSFEDIRQALQNFKKSGSAYLLTTTFTNRETNQDIQTGQWRALNLQKAPFNFPEPLRMINENYTAQQGRYQDKSMGIWEIDSLLL